MTMDQELDCGERMPVHDHQRVARLLHALAEPNRLAMVHLLARSEQRVTDVTAVLGLAQSTVSAHLATLREAGLVEVRLAGRSSWYRVSDQDVEHVIAAAEQVLARLTGGDAGAAGQIGSSRVPLVALS